MGPFSLQGFMPWYSVKLIPEVWSPEVQDNDFAVCLLAAPRTLNSTISWSQQPSLPLELHIPHQAFLIAEN